MAKDRESITIDREINKEVKKEARRHRRSYSGMIEYICSKYLENKRE